MSLGLFHCMAKICADNAKIIAHKQLMTPLCGSPNK